MVTAQICESGSPTLDACDFETCSMSDHYMSTRTYVHTATSFLGHPVSWMFLARVTDISWIQESWLWLFKGEGYPKAEDIIELGLG